LTMNNPRRIQRHFVRALAAGALLAAAALPLAIATAASAAATPAITSAVFTPSGAGNTIGAGSTGSVTVTGVGFAGDGGNFTLTGTGVAFAAGTETASTTTVTTTYTVGGTAEGPESLVLSDDANNGAGVLTLASAYTITPAPGSPVPSPAFIGVTQGATSVNISGGNFESGAKVSITDHANGTALTVGAATLNADGTLTVSVTPTNAVNGAAATTGVNAYDVTVTNPDGGSTTDASSFSVDQVTVSEVSPSALSDTAGPTTLTITGSGFEYGALVTTSAGCATDGLTFGYSTFGSPTTLTVVATTTGHNGAAPCDVTVTNPPASPGSPPYAPGTPPGNGDAGTLSGALGSGATSGTAAALITGSSSTAATAIVPGSAASSVTLTGLGFSADSIVVFSDPAVTTNSCTSSGGTTLTCIVTVASGAVAGTDSVYVNNGGTHSASFANGLYVAGPSITSMAPTAIVVGAPVGTVVVLTGTGFTNTMTLSGTSVFNGSLTGILEYESATTANFVVTASPDAGDVTTLLSSDSIVLSLVDSTGANVLSAPFNLTVDGPPAVTSVVTYATAGTSGVGVGAKAQGIVIHGVGFTTGATVTAFTNTAGVADANVTVTVTAVNAAGTQITATVAVAAGDLNTAVGYTVTNTDGGKAVVSAYQFPITIDAGPTITSVSPSTGLAGATNAFTLTGTGFTAASVVSVDTNGSCGATTFVSATSLTVTCTLGVLETTASNMLVTNPDGGTASTVILPAATTTPPPKPKPFHVSGVKGRAVAGETVNLEITGTGFHGQPRITSNAAGTRAVVSRDTGKVLVVRVTTRATTKPGVKVFTITQSGKRATTHYSVIRK
jgi:hypothetical protein